MALTDIAIKRLTAKNKPFRVTDERGLSLTVHPNGSKYWQFRYLINGREKVLSLGVYPEVSLAQARDKRNDARKLVVDGKDPIEVKKEQKQAVVIAAESLFGTIAENWYKFNQPKWAPATAEKCRTYLDKDILPALGSRPIFEITPQETAALIENIERRPAHNVAKKVRQWMRRIFSFAIAKGLTTTNPCDLQSRFCFCFTR